MYNLHCIYCEYKLDINDTVCPICGARIVGEKSYKKRFNYKPVLRAFIYMLILWFLLGRIFDFRLLVPVIIVIGSLYTGYKYKKISPESILIGGAIGLAIMAISNIFTAQGVYDYLIGFAVGVIASAVGGLLNMKRS